MKTPVVITLLILGTVLILAPFVFDYLNPVSVTQYPLEHERARVRDHRTIYAAVSWAAGIGMVAIGILSSLWSSRRVAADRQESVTSIKA